MSDYNEKNIITEVADLEDGKPISPSTRLYVNHESAFRQATMDLFLSYIRLKLGFGINTSASPGTDDYKLYNAIVDLNWDSIID